LERAASAEPNGRKFSRGITANRNTISLCSARSDAGLGAPFAYLGKIIIHPTPLTSFGEFIQRAAIGPVPGEAILAAGVVFDSAWIMFLFVTYYSDPNVVDVDLADYFKAVSL
jgi:hypothetical protein